MIEDKKVLAVTLARRDSKGIPHKNRKIIARKPLYEWTVDAALESCYIDKYVISTNDEEIINQQPDLVFRRSEELASDTASSADSLIEVVNAYPGYDYVVELMATNPLKTTDDIDSCIEDLNLYDVPSVVTVVKEENLHPRRMKYLISDGTMTSVMDEPPESRRQDLKPDVYLRNGSVYAVKTDHLLKHRTRYVERRTRARIVPSRRSVNIDSELDFIIAEYLLSIGANHEPTVTPLS